MVRLYRIAHDAGTLHAAEREGRFRLVDGDIFASFREGPEIVSDTARWLAPVCPSKIIGVGLNYRDRAAEIEEALPDEPRLVLKPPTAVVGPNAAIEVPTWAGRVDYEASVGVVIGRTARHVPARRAYDYVLGLTAVNDVTARDLERGDGQPTRARAFDTFAPVGPCIAVGLDGRDLAIHAYVNGDIRQDSRTREMIFTISELVEFVSTVMTLVPGDIILTGTPAGAGPVQPGDQVTIHVEGVGALTSPVVARDESAGRPETAPSSNPQGAS
jgi:2-keto-4-pentenoate hydratase/2-oxohepta-3-ene-1,7-dioic acid hydratase in catechol pathway